MAVVGLWLRCQLARVGKAIVARFEAVSGLGIATAVLFLVIAPQTSAAQKMSLPGSFEVNPTGAATYNVPIAVPPGTAGVAPSLTLTYNSQNGNGILGVGWSLDGLPSIGRCPRTWVQDGVPGGINYDANDRFCFEGQRLVAISGAYGADGTEYRTEVDSFSRILSHGAAGTGPAWFEVHTKSGQVMEFGHTADSQILAQGKATARSWALNKVSDSKSNYFTVAYVNDNANGQAYPDRIDYTANAAANLATYNSVQFVYAGRPDISSQYQAGSLMRTTVRLTNVKTFAGSALVADYRLAYQQSGATNRSRLSSIVLCEGGGACLPPTTFAWQDSAIGFAASLTSTGNAFNTTAGLPSLYPNRFYSSFANGPGLIALDLNGDGKSDFVQQYNDTNFTPFGALYLITYLSNGNGTFTTGTFVTGVAFNSVLNQNGMYGPGLIALDLNGDGKTDLVQQQYNANGYLALYTYLSNGDGTFTKSFQDPQYAGFASTVGGPGLIAVDVNGDGKTDLIQQYSNPAGYLAIFSYLSNGDGSFAFTSWTSPNGFNSTSSGPRLIAVDVNGDGKTDLIQQYNNSGYLTLIVYLSNGDGTFAASSQSFPDVSFNSTSDGPGLIPLDLNGDGKADLIQQYNNSGVLNLFTYLSNGDGTFTRGYQAFPGASFNSTSSGPGLIPLDLNGDGNADLIQQYNNSGVLNLFTYLSNGDGTFTQGYQSFSSSFDTTGQSTPGLIPVDVSGIGKAGLVQQYNTNNVLGLNIYTPTGSFPDLLARITNALGQTVSVTYAPLTDSATYTKDASATYPTQDLSGPVYVVSRVDTSNGVGGTYSSTYAYSGAKVDLRGRGFLGFRQVQVTDPQTGIVKTTSYRQDFPYVAMTSSVMMAKGSQTLNQSTSSLQFLNASGAAALSAPTVTSAPYRVSVSQSVTSSFDLDGSAIPSATTSYQYDAYNNATQVSVVTSDGYSKTTNNTYTNDAAKWLLGRLTASTVASQSPQQLGQYCPLPWGGTISSGQSVTAYSAAHPPVSQACSTVAETRTCTNGTLSGSFTSQSCIALCALPWGGTITAGQSVTAYSVAAVPAPQSCSSVAQTRSCDANGTLSGTYTKQTCAVVQPIRIYLTSGSSWTVPNDWNNSGNKIEVIGGGGNGGAVSSAGGGGAGGGAYSAISNLALTPGSTVSFNVGLGGSGGQSAPGGNTWFNGTSLSSASVSAQGGSGGLSGTAGTVPGGQASNGIGTTKYSGGAGGAGGYGGGGGGGAAGPNGNGAAGGSYIGGVATGGGGGGGANGGSPGGNDTLSPRSNISGNGGNGWQGNGGGVGNCVAGSNGGGGSGGYGGSCGGAAGGMDTVFDATHGAGGGGGGGGSSLNAQGRPGGPGAGYGGGGGGGGSVNALGGAGGNGIIVITYTPTIQ